MRLLLKLQKLNPKMDSIPNNIMFEVHSYYMERN